MIVLDTNALIFWTLDPQRLSPKAKQAIEQADYILISAIFIGEIAFKVKRQKLDIPLPVNAYVDRYQRVGNLEILAVEPQTWLDNVDLPRDHRDPADRTMVALAARNDCPLITSDEIIAKFYARAIWQSILGLFVFTVDENYLRIRVINGWLAVTLRLNYGILFGMEALILSSRARHFRKLSKLSC